MTRISILMLILSSYTLHTDAMEKDMAASGNGSDGCVSVTVFNSNSADARAEMVELGIEDIKSRLPSLFYYVEDSGGKEIPSQQTYDGKLIFKADCKAKGETSYSIFPSDEKHEYENQVYGKSYPERADDLAWENELGGYRAYGPATRLKGEKVYGYDIFFKHPGHGLILPVLYKDATSAENKVKLDSLKKIDPKEAKRFSRSKSFHYDHGLGMDCYAVGPTLGAGATAMMAGDSVVYQWCHVNAEILDNGPLRFTCRLDFSPFSAEGEEEMTEHRLITLDSESYLNRCRVWYDGLEKERIVVAGFPLRDSSGIYADETNGIIACSDPTQGKDNGRAMLGIILNKNPELLEKKHGHILIGNKVGPGESFDYCWGSAWDREAPFDFNGWTAHLLRLSRKVPLTIKYQTPDI